MSILLRLCLEAFQSSYLIIIGRPAVSLDVYRRLAILGGEIKKSAKHLLVDDRPRNERGLLDGGAYRPQVLLLIQQKQWSTVQQLHTSTSYSFFVQAQLRHLVENRLLSLLDSRPAIIACAKHLKGHT